MLRSTSLLPALFTLGNALCGFAAIHFATKDAVGQATMGHLEIAAWLIVGAMACDMLDGRLARMTRRTSDFGGQLDSLADVISFGVAPAVLMVRAVVTLLREQAGHIAVERGIICVAGVYVACAALRLARYNVENDPDESVHTSFWGLPTPGAAANLAALVLLLERAHARAWLSPAWLSYSAGAVLPAMTLIDALLMVSRVRYPHVVNQYISGRKSFGYLVRLVVVVLAAMLQPLVTGATIAVGYTLWGPLRAGWRMLKARPGAPPPLAPQ